MRLSTLRALAPLLALIWIGVSLAAPVVRPGDPAVDGSKLEPYENEWRYFKRSPDGALFEVGVWTDQLSIVDDQGERYIVRRQQLPSPQGEIVFTNRARQADLRPHSFQIAGADGQLLQRVEFEDTQLRVTAAGQDEATLLPIAEPVFDWLLYGILAATFPLEEGYEATFPGLTEGLELTMRSLAVGGKETLTDAAGTSHNCWIVEMDDGLSFWVSERPPYILRAEMLEETGAGSVWELAHNVKVEPVTAAKETAPSAGYSTFLELRAYETRDAMRDRFMAHFEQHYLESQEAEGMRIWGQFLDRDVDENFVWIRGYRSMSERFQSIMSFYTGDVWRDTSAVVGEILTSAAHVHFLEPVTPDDALDQRAQRVAEEHPTGIVVAQLFPIEDEDAEGLLSHIRQSWIPSLTANGATSLGLFRSSDEPNNIPQMPFIEDEPSIVWFASYASRERFDDARRRGLAAQPEGAPAPFEAFVLQPGQRSRLFHRGPAAAE